MRGIGYRLEILCCLLHAMKKAIQNIGGDDEGCAWHVVSEPSVYCSTVTLRKTTENGVQMMIEAFKCEKHTNCSTTD